VVISTGAVEETGSEEAGVPPHDASDKNTTSVMTVTEQLNTRFDTVVLF
jgi:hypothetical protein